MTEDGRAVASFEKLEVFQRAYRVSLEVHRASLEFRRSNSMRWPINCGGRANPSARTSRRVLPGRSGRRRSSDGFSRWRSGRVTRCGFGCGIAWIWAISASRAGSTGETSIRGSQGCCRACIARRKGDLPSSVFCLLSSASGSGAFRKAVKVSREACWSYRKREC